ncbi:MAG: tripartite tricarboxylate transporter permease [Pseudohongiellaceae bacterium]
MFELLSASLFQIFTSPYLLLTIVAAVFIGSFFGLVPGLGGTLAMVLFIPLMIGRDPLYGIVFLIAMHAVVHTAGSIPSILFGIPGTGADAATVVDGLPMTQQGKAGTALGAALFASAVGGIIGGMFLLLMLPVVTPVINLITPSEYFLLAILGISFMSAVSGSSLRKGVAVGCLGLCFSFVGISPQSAEMRFTFGQIFLWDGLDLVTLVLAVFAIPDLLFLDRRKKHTLEKMHTYTLGHVISGIKMVFVHRWLAFRTSLLGAVIGLVPGMGGDVASWMCYGHAVQSSKNPDQFGKGAVEGVIAPETANNSKEGGALIPTLFFGVPGSNGMAVFLLALTILGVQPGPGLLAEQGGLVTSLIVTLVLANLLAVAILLPASRYLAQFASIPAGTVIPVGLVMIVLGSYLSSGNWEYLLILYAMSMLGFGLKYYRWPRAPFVIGVVLGANAETSYLQAITIWDYGFFLKPLSLILIAAICSSVAVYFWRRRQEREHQRAGLHYDV